MKSERIHRLNKAPIKQGLYILYLMQTSQRLHCNLALCQAAHLANETGLPLLIVFRLKPDYPEANYRHFRFMVDGLLQCATDAIGFGIGFELSDLPEEQLYSHYLNQAAAIICDQGYLYPQQKWQTDIAATVSCLMETVEDNLIIPIASASNKAEWSARTIRPKLMKKISYFAGDAETKLPPLKYPFRNNASHNNETAERFLETTRKNKYLAPVDLSSGERTAQKILNDFIENKLTDYSQNRKDPSLAGSSRLSPYLHFGQISPLQILQKINTLPYAGAFIEELLIRRELAHNFVYFTPHYDDYTILPAWSRKTLKEHWSDLRPQLYSPKELENATTTDSYWNAAMYEMQKTGFMENTMRMYWGKKIIEWSRSPEEAYTTIITLNNRYFLDGRDANSYAGVGWCFGLHDRPWPSKPIFGTVRSMTAQGLARKYDMNTYCKKILL